MDVVLWNLSIFVLGLRTDLYSQEQKMNVSTYMRHRICERLLCQIHI